MNEQMNHMSRHDQAIKDFMYHCLIMSKEEQIIDRILAKPIDLNTLAKIPDKWI